VTIIFKIHYRGNVGPMGQFWLVSENWLIHSKSSDGFLAVWVILHNLT